MMIPAFLQSIPNEHHIVIPWIAWYFFSNKFLGEIRTIYMYIYFEFSTVSLDFYQFNFS